MSGRVSDSRMREWLKLYLVMGSVNCRTEPLEVLREALEGGITLFQFREKGPSALEGRAKTKLAAEMRDLCRRYGVPFIVNDDVALALDVDADGIHVGQEDEAAREVRRKAGDKIVGISAHNLDEARQAIADGADYLGVGPMYPTASKPDAREVQGPALVRSLRMNGIGIPIVGIGGITPERSGAVLAAGADGVAVISAISLADDVQEVVRQFRATAKQIPS